MLTHWLAGAVIALLTGACGWSAGRARGATEALGLALNERDYLRGKIARVEGEPPPQSPPPADKKPGVVESIIRDRFSVKENP